MKTRQLLAIITSAALAAGFVACQKKEAPKPAPKQTESGDALKGMTDAAKDAAGKVGETVDKAATELKEKAIAAAQSAYDNAKKEFDALTAKISSSSSPEKPIWQKAADGIKAQFSDADKQLSDLKADNSDWKTLSENFTSFISKISEGIKNLASQVK